METEETDWWCLKCGQFNQRIRQFRFRYGKTTNYSYEFDRMGCQREWVERIHRLQKFEFVKWSHLATSVKIEKLYFCLWIKKIINLAAKITTVFFLVFHEKIAHAPNSIDFRKEIFQLCVYFRTSFHFVGSVGKCAITRITCQLITGCWIVNRIHVFFRF